MFLCFVVAYRLITLRFDVMWIFILFYTSASEQSANYNGYIQGDVCLFLFLFFLDAIWKFL